MGEKTTLIPEPDLKIVPSSKNTVLMTDTLLITMKKDGINYSEPTDQVEILNEQIVSAFTKEDCTSIPTMGNSTVNSAPPLSIQVNGKKLLLSQKLHKASGPDQISPRFLKEMASPIPPTLTFIYQASYEQGQVPDDWKRAFVTPLFKKGDKSKASNYRPVY